MECFGTNDFDDNSRLITLSAIIISGLHCINIHNHTQNTTSHVLYVIVNIYIRVHTIMIDAPTGKFHIEFNTRHF
jgi:hypothetical protein